MTRSRTTHRPVAAGRALAALAMAALASALAAPALAAHGVHDPRALAEDPRRAEGPIAPVLEGLGDLHVPVTTSSERAQLFFDQGLKLTYGFNHQEALRSFKEAARLDPECAMCYWGWALVLGPNLNLAMQPQVVEQAWTAIRRAVELAEHATEKEREFIEALATRYAADPEADRAPLDAAYAEAMAGLWALYPDDDEAATLYAAAIMNTTPWNYWTKDGRPTSSAIEEAIAALEKVIGRSPTHIGALHYFIHIVEAVDPARAEPAADLLRGLAPGAGHLVHMPSHIYMPLGRFAEAYDANARAVEADEGYVTQCRAQGIYPLTYYPHNLHFLAWAATLEGRSAAALEAARKVAARVPDDLEGNHWALYESFLVLPLDVMLVFEMWNEILAEPRPPELARFWTGMWHFARGMAWVRTDRPRRARRELARLEAVIGDPAAAEARVGFSQAATLLAIGRQVLSGELGLARGETDRALARFERAVRLEDRLPYNEPPSWFTPARQYLARALLRVGRPGEAETVYWQDLRKRRDNGFALRGLGRALTAQRRFAEAEVVRQRLRRAWQRADVRFGPAFDPPTRIARAGAESR